METNKKRGIKPFVLPEGVVVDWSKSNQQIANDLGLKSPITIAKLRLRMGAPVNPRGKRKKVVETVEAVQAIQS